METNQLEKLEAVNTGAMEIATTKSAQEVQAAVLMAKHYPRDQQAAVERLLQACKRIGLAEESQYAFPRGGKQITGPSIRLAEVAAQCWGNMDCSLIELQTKDSESQMMSRAWDLETNTISSKVFTVKHERDTQQGAKKLDSNRDVYEMTANQGQRRLRSNILAIIPGDIIDLAIAECNKTLAGNNDEPIGDRVAKMIKVFNTVGVTKEMIEERIQKNADALLDIDIVNLGKIFKSLKDGMSDVKEWFKVKGAEADFGGKKQEPAKKAEPEKKVEPKKEPAAKPVEKKAEAKKPVEKKTEPKAEPKAEPKKEPEPEPEPDMPKQNVLPEFKNTPELEKLIDGAMLTVEQCFKWAESGHHDIMSEKIINNMVEKWDKIRDAIAKF